MDTNISRLDNPVLWEKRMFLKKELSSLYQEDSTAAYIRSRAKWLEEGEKSTSYFLNLEKHNQSMNCINILENGNGVKITKDSEILEEVRKFYTKLYSSTKPNNIEVDK